MAKRRRRFPFVAFALSGTAGCHRSPPMVIPPDVGGTYGSPVSSGITCPGGTPGRRYPYAAAADRERAITSGYPGLRVGQTREQVRQLLGPPGDADPMCSKQLSPRFTGWAFTYTVRANEPANTNNANVEVFFDPNNRLHSAVPSHVPGLAAVGHVGPP